MNTVHLEINGIPVEAPEGTSILAAARQVQVKIPTLCYHSDLEPWAACGICVVKVEGSPKMLRACATPVWEGMNVLTHDPEIVRVRRSVIELILSTHPNDCLRCPRNGNCELQQLAADFGIRDMPFEQRVAEIPQDRSTPSIVLNPEKCVKCGRCALVCQGMQNVWALEFLDRGENMRIAPSADVELNDSPCIKCGQCSAHCPVGAIYEKDETRPVWDALEDDNIYPVVQVAPAVRVAIGEAFGYEPGTLLTGKLYAALRRLGFKAIFDTNFGADLTIVEESAEFVERFVEGDGALPLITSCCPSWTDYMEKFAPDFIDNFSSAKSPHAMTGAMAKTYYAQQADIDPARIYMVSIMPCTSKKYEITRTDEMFSSGYQDVDRVLTTRELARMLKSSGVEFTELDDERSDSILGEYSGAGTIFGVTGGVMEAAVRTACHVISGERLQQMPLTAVRGLEGVKEAELEIAGKTVRVAVAHSMTNIEVVLDRLRENRRKGEEPYYHFVEVMACPGGCVGGGGQPYGVDDDVRARRAAGLYSDDEKAAVRCSHENPAIKRIYEDFLGKPLSNRSHRYLHTVYHRRAAYKR